MISRAHITEWRATAPWAMDAHVEQDLYGSVDPDRVVTCMLEYMRREGLSVTRAEFERNLHEKMRDPAFGADIRPLLSTAIEYDPTVAADHVFRTLLVRLPGERWKGLPE